MLGTGVQRLAKMLVGIFMLGDDSVHWECSSWVALGPRQYCLLIFEPRQPRWAPEEAS